VQQGPQYPYPPQQQPYYPGYPPPKPGGGKTALVIVLVVAGVLVLGGLGVGAFFLFRPDGNRSVTAAPTSASPAGEPDKYSALPRCSEVGDRMKNLPPLEKDAAPEPASTSAQDLSMTQLGCSWRQAGSSSGQVTMYLVKSNEPGSGAGPQYAKAGYENDVKDGAKPITAGIGSATKAADVDYDNGVLQCGVRFYQGNVDVIVIVSAAEATDRNTDRCRRNAHSLAEAVSESLG
jgi:hypothetical protein